MATPEELLRSLLVDQHLDALRFAEGLDADAQGRLNGLARDVRRLLADFDGASRTAYEALIAAIARLINEGVSEISAEQIVQLKEFASVVAEGTASAVNKTVGAAVMDVPNRISSRVEKMIVAGAPSSDWWAAQAHSTKRSFAREVRTGFVNGETTDKIAGRLVGLRGTPGVLDITRRQARSLVHTSVQTVANQSRQEVFTANADIVEGLDWLATLDNSTCPVCGIRDGKRFTLSGQPVGHRLGWDGGPGSIHFACRCVSVPRMKPIMVNGKEFSFRPTERASQDGPVSASLTFEGWLAGKSPGFQDEYFGTARAEMFRQGKLTLADLLDMRGRPLTLDQLRQKYR